MHKRITFANTVKNYVLVVNFLPIRVLIGIGLFFIPFLFAKLIVLKTHLILQKRIINNKHNFR